jgi:hypothetical protein
MDPILAANTGTTAHGRQRRYLTFIAADQMAAGLNAM